LRGRATALKRFRLSQQPAHSKKDAAMKLSSPMIEKTLTQFDAQAIPENHPVSGQLNSLFGDHTFFLDANGLNIVEPANSDNSGRKTAQVIKLAAWQDEKHSSLAPHEPEPTDVLVVIEPTDAA
jgi:hypothetical protein